MRDIKFRAWNDELKLFRIDWKLDKFSPYINLWFENTDWIVEQFTGLQDREGKDIYEGDRLRFNDHIGSRLLPSGEVERHWPNFGTVFWDSGWGGNPDAKFNCTEDGGNNQPTWWICSSKTVIGNIHET